MAFIFMDESGNLGFDFSKRGTTSYFLITFLFVPNKRTIEKCVRKVHTGLRKKYKKVGVLHAYREEPVTRKRLLSLLAAKDCRVMTILLNKRKVYTKLQDEKPVLYNYVTNILLDRIFSRKLLQMDDPIEIIASRKETNKFLNQNFKTYLQSQMTENHDVNVTISIKTPAEEKALQAVDFVCWAIFRKHEYKDNTYYKIIRSNIIEENPLFP
jgi:arsenate reductase-like glutaredoxin family protein